MPTYLFTGSRAGDQLLYESAKRGDAVTMQAYMRDVFGLRPPMSFVDTVMQGLQALAAFKPRDRGKILQLLTARPEPKRVEAIRYVMDRRAREGIETSIKEARDLIEAMWGAVRLSEERIKPRAQVLERNGLSGQPALAAATRPGPPSPAANDDTEAEEAGPSIEEFAAHLRRARRWAGEPSLSQVADAVGYSTATVSRALAGKVLPKWSLVELLLAEFRVPEEEIDGAWHRQWLHAREEQNPVGIQMPSGDAASGPDSSGEPSAAARLEGQVCEACGSWAVDLKAHRAWHWELENQIRRITQRRTLGEV